MLAGDVMRAFERRAVGGLVQNSGPPLLNVLLWEEVGDNLLQQGRSSSVIK